jgi:glutathione peroxidase
MLRPVCLAAIAAIGLGVLTHAAEKKAVPAALNFKMKSLEGKEVDLSKYEGKVVLIVNTASECGLTPQYKELQALFDKDKSKGLVILGFPCNQFGKQEPGTEAEISKFCTENYGVKFDMFSKVDVNGDNAAPLYKYLTALDTKPKEKGDVSWNFEKFLLNKKGEVVARFAPQTTPDSKEVTEAIDKELAAK